MRATQKGNDKLNLTGAWFVDFNTNKFIYRLVRSECSPLLAPAVLVDLGVPVIPRKYFSHESAGAEGAEAHN
ncbi:MAG: hypothetical protein O7D30_03030, partial [Rickettsia endosymbiont of Ixodes persulcatus]|nr:hypothetical protein [Rickettsia endosymbiont of Ixodes persulcatus]